MTAAVRAVDPDRDWEDVADLLTRHGPERVEAAELSEEHGRIVEGKLLHRFVAERDGVVVGRAGALTLETETNVENHPIRALNRALGYRELPGYRTLSRRV